MTEAEISRLQRHEGNIVKTLIGIRKRARTTKLLEANKIETMRERIDDIKLKFYKRIMNNDITREIYREADKQNTIYLKSNQWNSFNNEIKYIIKD